jgi:hypothetical protein
LVPPDGGRNFGLSEPLGNPGGGKVSMHGAQICA